MKLSDFFKQPDVKLFGGYIACYIGVFVCICLKMSMKQVIANLLCMNLNSLIFPGRLM